jgi:hypothetical protein
MWMATSHLQPLDSGVPPPQLPLQAFHLSFIIGRLLQLYRSRFCECSGCLLLLLLVQLLDQLHCKRQQQGGHQKADDDSLLISPHHNNLKPHLVMLMSPPLGFLLPTSGLLPLLPQLLLILQRSLLSTLCSCMCRLCSYPLQLQLQSDGRQLLHLLLHLLDLLTACCLGGGVHL